MLSAKRPRHQHVLDLLNLLSAELLESSACYFGGGTRIALELGEYRESLDVDFLCANQDGYRELRNQVSTESLGRIFAHQPILLREVRADMYGIRTFVEIDAQPIKFEIIREARILLGGTSVSSLPIPCLDHTSCVAEKFLANTDRGLDKSTRSRDLVDLAFMAGKWTEGKILDGLKVAEAAYGASVLKILKSTLENFADDNYKKLCLNELKVHNSRPMEAGLQRLTELLRK